MVGRALLVVSRKAGTGRREEDVEVLRARLAARLPACDVHALLARDHAEARAGALGVLRADAAPAALLVGGGSGTLRAAVEACCELGDGTPPSHDRVRIAPLRMGSGNMVAKKLGYPRDAAASADAAAAGLLADRVQPAAVIRVDAGARRCFGLSMAGFGAFGRVAADVERWPRSWPRARGVLARALGVETWTNVEYGACIVARCAEAALRPASCELLRLTHDGVQRELRLLAGLLFTFRIPQYPFDPGVAFGEPRATLHVVELPRTLARRLASVAWPPLLARGAEALTLDQARGATLELLDRDAAAFFVDEDAETFSRALRVSVAGTLPLVPAG